MSLRHIKRATWRPPKTNETCGHRGVRGGNNIRHTLDKIKKQNAGEKKREVAGKKNRSAASNVIGQRRKIPTNGSQNAGGSRASWQCPAPVLLLLIVVVVVASQWQLPAAAKESGNCAR